MTNIVHPKWYPTILKVHKIIKCGSYVMRNILQLTYQSFIKEPIFLAVHINASITPNHWSAIKIKEQSLIFKDSFVTSRKIKVIMFLFANLLLMISLHNLQSFFCMKLGESTAKH